MQGPKDTADCNTFYDILRASSDLSVIYRDVQGHSLCLERDLPAACDFVSLIAKRYGASITSWFKRHFGTDDGDKDIREGSESMKKVVSGNDGQ